jgi:hypothetical protein
MEDTPGLRFIDILIRSIECNLNDHMVSGMCVMLESGYVKLSHEEVDIISELWSKHGLDKYNLRFGLTSRFTHALMCHRKVRCPDYARATDVYLEKRKMRLADEEEKRKRVAEADKLMRKISERHAEEKRVRLAEAEALKRLAEPERVATCCDCGHQGVCTCTTHS